MPILHIRRIDLPLISVPDSSEYFKQNVISVKNLLKMSKKAVYFKNIKKRNIPWQEKTEELSRF